MEKNRKNIYSVLAIFLLIIGVSLDAVVLTAQNRQIILSEEEQLRHLAQSIDSNVSSIFRSSKIILNSEQSRYSTRNAELEWIWYRESGNLLNRLQADLVDDSDIVDAVLVIRWDKPVLSTNGELDYHLDTYTANGSLLPCTRDDGSLQLLIVSDKDEYGISYAEVINVPALYNRIVSSDMASDKWVLLLDSNAQVMIHHQKSSVMTESVDAVTGATCGIDGITALQKIQAQGVSESERYEYSEEGTNSKHVAYMYVMPSSETRNGYFAIGVSGQVDGKIQVQNYSILGYAVSTILIAAGIVLISLIFRRHSMEERAHMAELELLREKNREMEVLEGKRKELAHLDRLETIGTLTSGIAHEFNNLLTPIMAYSLLTLEKLPEDDEEIGEYLESIYNASTRAKSVVSRLSDLSRSGAEKIYSVCNIETIIDKAVESAAPACPKNVALSKDYSEGLAALVNELQIHQMMLNLILNAYHAMTPDGGTLLIRTQDDGDNIMITVSDSGPGIKEEIKDKVFDPFFTTKDHNKGTGLGLAICRQTVEDHKGNIVIAESELGGASFVITIPKDMNNEK